MTRFFAPTVLPPLQIRIYVHVLISLAVIDACRSSLGFDVPLS